MSGEMSGRYIRENEDLGENLRRIADDASTPPLTHTIYTGDFMALCTHDIACPVCFDRHAMITRNVTPGQWSQAMGPCGECQAKGWILHRQGRVEKFLRKFFGAYHD